MHQDRSNKEDSHARKRKRICPSLEPRTVNHEPPHQNRRNVSFPVDTFEILCNYLFLLVSLTQKIQWHSLVSVNGPLQSVPALSILSTYILIFILQIVKPLWPFIFASSVTFYLIAKAQSSGVRCTCQFLYEKFSL